MATILIIEDDEALAKILARALSGHRVLLAVNGRDGLAQAISQTPDLIVLDILLPGMSGIEVLAELKAGDKTAAIPVMVLTNLNDPATVEKILAAGGKDYFVKTDWTLDQLVEKIRNLLTPSA